MDAPVKMGLCPGSCSFKRASDAVPSQGREKTRDMAPQDSLSHSIFRQLGYLTPMSENFQPEPAQAEPPERPARQAMFRGLRLKCPNCGSGPLMRSYLKVRDHCPVCGEELYHHRADDGPAYLTILITGHIIAPLIFFVFFTFRPDPLVMAVGFTIGFVAIALFMLPRLKGMFVGLQWAKRMHGFGRSNDIASG